jgi:sugar phosphate isomerase/epimerase
VTGKMIELGIFSRTFTRPTLAELALVLPVAETAGLRLAFEPEPGNVVTSAPAARRLLDTLGSPVLKVVLDPANLFEPATPLEARRLAETAVALLGGAIVLTHAKDRTAAGHVRPAAVVTLTRSRRSA